MNDKLYVSERIYYTYLIEDFMNAYSSTSPALTPDSLLTLLINYQGQFKPDLILEFVFEYPHLIDVFTDADIHEYISSNHLY